MKDFYDHSDWLEAKVKLQTSAAISFRKKVLDWFKQENEWKEENKKKGMNEQTLF